MTTPKTDAGAVPTVHLLHGYIGAGKTTFAKRLAAERRAMRFTVDEWIAALYGPRPERLHEVYGSVTALMWKTAGEAVKLGLDVVYDSGLWTRASRDQARAWAACTGAAWRLYHVDCPLELARVRTVERARTLDPLALYVDETIFDARRVLFEALGADEPHVRIVTA